MDSSTTFENVKTWLLETLNYIEENIVRLPRKSSIRLLLIIGAYCLIRPYLLKGAGIKQTADYEQMALAEGKDEDEAQDSPAVTEANEASKSPAKTSGSNGRDDDTSRATGNETARRRQQRPTQELTEEHEEQSGADAGSDKEIEEFLRKAIT